MSEKNGSVVRRYFDVIWNQGQTDRFEEFYSKDIVPHGTAGVTDIAGLKQSVMMFRNAVPDLQVAIEDEITSGDKVVMRWTLTGTHQGDLPGAPATGKPLNVPGMTIFRLADDKIAEFWLQSGPMG
jgi:steroid delta-isomerase-like uncharacterized protein